MSPAVIQLIVLAGIAVFLFIRLKNVLGTREGFEPKTDPTTKPNEAKGPSLEIIEGGLDRDITDHVEMDSPEAVSYTHLTLPTIYSV